jgi:hypothetical protein
MVYGLIDLVASLAAIIGSVDFQRRSIPRPNHRAKGRVTVGSADLMDSVNSIGVCHG